MLSRLKLLNGNVIKIIGAITMLIDHLGMILFPHIVAFRIIGRLSFPLFAFMIAEGARYTKSKAKYILTIGILGLICQIPMIILFSDFHWNVLITFTMSIGFIYLLSWFKKSLLDTSASIFAKSLPILLFVIGLMLLFLASIYLGFSYTYDFWGCMIGVFAFVPCLFNSRWINNTPVRVLLAGIPLLIYSLGVGGHQLVSLLSLAILLLYSGKKGKLNLKYFFYIFYPAHLVVLYGIAIIILSLVH